MNTSLLVEKLQARGIRLELDNGQLDYSSDKPVPTGILNTLAIETPQIIRHLKSLPPDSVDDAPVNTFKSDFLRQLGDDAPMFEKVLEIFPPGGPVVWTPAVVKEASEK